MADKLKQCPFCGNEAKYHDSSCAEEICEYVSCLKCNAQSPLMYRKGEAVEWWNRRPSPWHTGTPTVNDQFYIREVFILQFSTPTGGWYFHGHLFKPDFSNKCFRSWVDKSITFEFDCPNLWWQKIEP